MLRLLAKRHHELVAGRTRAVCRLHTTLCYLAEGHFPKRMTARPGRRHPGPDPARRDLRRTQSPGASNCSPRSAASIATSPSSNGRISTAVAASASTRHRHLRRRSHRRRLPDRPHRRHRPLPERRALRPLQRHRPDRSLQRHPHPAPFQPRRQPSTQPRPPHRRRHPARPQHARARLLPPQTSRRPSRKEAMRASSDASPTPSTASSSPTPTLKRGPGRATRDDYEIQRGRLNPEHRHFGKPLPDPTQRYAPPPSTCIARALDQALDTNRVRSGRVSQDQLSAQIIQSEQCP